MSRYFHLFSCCVPVRGHKKAVICDLQRNIVQPIPATLYEILMNDNDADTITVEDISRKYGHKERQLIEEYITFLYHNQFGYTSERPLSAVRLDLSKYEESRAITNAIVDFDRTSTHSLLEIVPQLNELHCSALELRYFCPLCCDTLRHELTATLYSSIRSIELLVECCDECTLENILHMKKDFPAIRKITVSSAHEDVVYSGEDISIIFTTEKIGDERCCGVVNELYCIAETQLFIESIHFNSCLNRKISVDRSGWIKNCPSMRDSFGHVSTTKLKEVVEQEAFRKLWKISKDQIEVCRDCELRYVCQDCRAYITDSKNLYSKPLKCTYNPYD